MIERIPPNSPELEASVLSAILQDNQAEAALTATLTPEDFYQDQNRDIFKAAAACARRGIAADVRTVSVELDRVGRLFDVGGGEYLGRLVESPSSPNWQHHSRLLQEKAERRRIIRAAERIAALGYGEAEAVEDYRAKAEATLFQAMQTGRESDILTPREIAGTLDEEAPPFTLKVGLGIFDEPRPIIAEGRLIVIAGRPGMGKTALACGILAHLALANPPVPCFFASLEQTAREIAERILAIQTGRTLYAVQSETLPVSAVERLATSGLYLSDAGAPSLATVLGQIRAARASYGIRLVLADHLGKVSGGRKESRSLEVGDVARGLKAIAKDLRIPVLAVCQLNRAVESRNVPRPQLSDLRESGEIEQEADAVLFLWTAEEGRRRAQLPATFTLAKNRHGPCGEVTLTFDQPRLRFVKGP